ncbi:MAG: DUF5058 family protein [Acholeplasmatales bacterium]|nr:DUF5058 family protein [Acholeplasmatales bacterium]
MDMSVANSWWMYLLGALVTVFVLAGSIFFLIRSLKDAKKINMDKKKINQVILSSTIFTILPSISILIGVVALSGKIGVPLPWIRLSVIGALHYETSAVSAVETEFLNYGVNTMTNEVFVTAAFVMTLGILVGPLFCLFGFKLYDKKLLSKAKVNEAENDEIEVVESNEEVPSAEVVEVKEEPTKKRGFGDILFSAAFIAMVCSFTAVEFSKLARGTKNDAGEVTKEPVSWIILLSVVVITFGCMALFDLIEKKLKQKWIANFSLGLSMIIGMAAAVLLGMVI